jgi:hypothetical protein
MVTVPSNTALMDEGNEGNDDDDDNRPDEGNDDDDYQKNLTILETWKVLYWCPTSTHCISRL